MQLTAPFSYIDAKGSQWNVPKGTVVDGASIPRVLWSVVGPPFTGKYRKSSVIHDFFCATMARPWHEVHQVFFEASLAEGNDAVHSRLMYAAVYAWGPRWDIVDGKAVRTRDMIRLPTDQEFEDLFDWIKSSDRALPDIETYVQERFPRSISLSEKRVALVIGNSAYQHTPKLINPRNDAADVAATLKGLGYDVVEGFDLDKAAMDRTIRQFANALNGVDAGVFFYAGHGLQVSGQNYLVPVDAKLENASGLDFEMVRLDLVHKTMERESKTNVIFLDACRDNPLARNLARAMGTRNAEIGRGLAAVESGVGTLISFSTQPGNVALDGTGRNSPFSEALAKRIKLSASSEDLSTLLIGVRNEVMAATKNKQVPWEHSALRARFFFSPPPPEARKPSAQDYDREMEIAFWNAVKDSKDAEILGTYLERFPTGTFAVLARVLIDRLQQQNAARAALAAREAELKRAEEAKFAAEATRAEEERKLEESRRQEEVAKARDEVRKTQETARIAEEERQAALRAAEETRKAAAAAKAAQETAAVREEELRRAEEAKKAADAKRADEQRRMKEAKLQEELSKAKEDARKAQEAAKRAEAERLAALKTSEEARKAAEVAKAAEVQSQREEEAKKLADAKRADEQRRLAEAKRQEEIKKAREDAQKAEQAKEAVRVAEAERLTAQKAAEEARKVTEAAKAEQEAAALQAKKEPAKVASLPSTAEPQPSSAAPVDTSALIRAIQTELKRIGCEPGSVDGKWGDKAKGALGQFIKVAKPDLKSDEPSEAALSALAIQKARVCPLQCGPSEFNKGGICVPRTEPARKTTTRAGEQKLPSRAGENQKPSETWEQQACTASAYGRYDPHCRNYWRRQEK